MKKGEDRDRNVNRLLSVAQTFLDHIIKTSLEACPVQIREVCECLRREVEARFPNASCSAVGGFYFLRFVCPTIVSPEVIGIEGMFCVGWRW